MKKKIISQRFSIKKFLKDNLIPISIFFFTFVIYLHNLSKSIYGFDTGDFVAAVITHGIAHPSGYPLFTMLGILFNLLPFGTAAWKVGLVSAIFSAFTVVVCYLITTKILGNKFIAITASLIIAFLYPFWLYAEVAEIFALHSFFIVLLIYLGILFYKSQKNIYIYLLSFFLGLSLTNNEVIILVFPSILIFVLARFRKFFEIKIIINSILLFLIGLLPYFYILIAGFKNPAVSPVIEMNFENFLGIIMRNIYGWGFGAGDPSSVVNLYFNFLLSELGGLLVVLAVIGVSFLYRKREYIFVLSIIAGFLLSGPFFYFYFRTSTATFFDIGLLERFCISSSILLLLLVPYGMQQLVTLFDTLLQKLVGKTSPKSYKRSYSVLFVLIFMLIPIQLFLNNNKRTDLSNANYGEVMAFDILSNLPKNSIVILKNDNAAYNTRYLQLAKNYRTDVFVPTDFTYVRKYVDNNSLLKKSEQKLLKKYPKIDQDTLMLLTLLPVNTKRPLFYLSPVAYNAKEYKNQIKFVPFGILQKVEDTGVIVIDEKTFIKRQNKLLSQTQTEDLLVSNSLTNSNYNFLSIKSMYANSYMNTAFFMLGEYKDIKSAKNYILKARKLDTSL